MFEFYLVIRECSSLLSNSTLSFEKALRSLQAFGLRQSASQSRHAGVGGEDDAEASEHVPAIIPNWKFTPSKAWENFMVEERSLDPDEAA